ncbi:endonuclease III, partial [Candidatus Dojkabacteria bacterium]|nr:endonuclease III [Candidatus Dojkabacteria bacterium]
VNKVTRVLFKNYPTLSDFANASIEDIEKAVYSTGYFKSKARYIKGSAEKLIADYGGKVPLSIHDLTTLPGVGRKTANVVLGVLNKNQDGVVVDTHVSRISYRLGLTTTRTNREKAEKELNVIIPKKEWEHYSLYLINHGRKYCIARNPKCETCPVRDICPKVGV